MGVVLVFLGNGIRSCTPAAAASQWDRTGHTKHCGFFGTQTVALVTQAGAIGLLLLFGGFIVIAAGTAMGLRTLAVASSRRRS